MSTQHHRRGLVAIDTAQPGMLELPLPKSLFALTRLLPTGRRMPVIGLTEATGRAKSAADPCSNTDFVASMLDRRSLLMALNSSLAVA